MHLMKNRNIFRIPTLFHLTHVRHNSSNHDTLRRLLFGAGIAEKESATLLNVSSNFLNLVAVVVVISINNPFPTTDADMYAFRLLSLMAGVRVVKLTR